MAGAGRTVVASEIIDRALLDFVDHDVIASEGSPFKRLFNVWRALHERLKTATVDAEKLLDAQTSLMSMAAHLPARSVEDALYKLAFWRWDSNDLEAEFSSLQRGDQIAYSAFRDLATLTGESDVLTPTDVASNYLSSAPKSA
jgi:hypothetical protein